MKKKKLKIIVLSGGRGDERNISLKSGRVVAAALDRALFDVTPVALTSRLDFIFPRKERLNFFDGLKKLQMTADCIFPALHGEFGEDGKLQSILELARIPFVGSGSLASMLAMDKGISDLLFRESGFRTPRTLVIRQADDVKRARSFLRPRGRFVVKPVNGGSSVGVLISNKRGEIERQIFHDLKKGRGSILQEFIAGRELTCGVIEKKNKIIALVPTEIRPKSSSFFDYRAKYEIGGSEEITPPDIPKAKINEVQRSAIRAHKLLRCRGVSRTDFILAKNTLFILETNTLPGMTETSLLPQGAAALGISFMDLLTILIRRAIEK